MERKVLELIAQDRIHIPLSSMDQKLKKSKMGCASEIADLLKEEFDGERSYAFVQYEDKSRARGMKEAIREFTEQYPRYGAILKGMIEEKRVMREKHLYFGMNQGCKLASEDYISAIVNIGLSGATARSLYPDLMDISRKLSRARNEDRSVIVGRYDEE